MRETFEELDEGRLDRRETLGHRFSATLAHLTEGTALGRKRSPIASRIKG